jgi:hypothetical protein
MSLEDFLIYMHCKFFKSYVPFLILLIDCSNHTLEYSVQYCYISKSLDSIDSKIIGNEME